MKDKKQSKEAEPTKPRKTSIFTKKEKKAKKDSRVILDRASTNSPNVSRIPFELLDFKTRVKMVTGYDDIAVDKSCLKEALANYFQNIEKLNQLKDAVQKGEKVKEVLPKEIKKKTSSKTNPGEELHQLINEQNKLEIMKLLQKTNKKALEELDEFVFYSKFLFSLALY